MPRSAGTRTERMPQLFREYPGAEGFTVSCSDGYLGNGAGGVIYAQRVRVVRRTGQRVGVDAGLLE